MQFLVPILLSAQQNQLGMNCTVWLQNHNSAAEERLFTKCFRLLKNETETKQYFEISAHMHKLCIISPWKILFCVFRYYLEMALVFPVLQE